MDSCHSGTAMDLPYMVDATESKMHSNDKFGINALMKNPAALGLCALLACCFADDILEMLF
jgi:hypothetical protein